MNKDVTTRVKEIQTSMVAAAESCFDESELGHLRAVIRLTVEFHDYLEHGRVRVLQGLKDGPDANYFKDLQSPGADRSTTKYDLEWVCGSVRAGIDSFCALNAGYRLLNGATDSNLKWSMISSKETFKSEFLLMFNRFTKEEDFESKCRLLLDLFKLQMVFAGFSCG
jgi:hypothetical protein